MSELALRLIAENKRTKEKFLDLGNCGLKAVPEEIGECVWLESISFADQWRGWDGRSWGRHVSRNNGETGHSLSDIRALSRLTGLRRLYLNDTQVSDIGPLSGLRSLRTLDLGRTKVSDVGPLADLASLQFLYLPDTQVSDVAPLAGLVSIRKLDLSGTQVTDLYALTPLVRNGLPVRPGSLAEEGRGISVEGCSLTSPPPEIVQQGSEAIVNYFCQVSRGPTDRLNEAKLLLLGEAGAGKTSLLRRLYQPNMPLPEADESTKGIDIYRHEFRLTNGRKFRLNVWDFGGQDIYHATHHFFLTRRSLYVLVDDARNNHSSVTDDGFKYWLDLVESFGGNSPVLIFQNQKGGRSKAIDLSGIHQRYENVKEQYVGNLAHVSGAEKLKAAIEVRVQELPHIGEAMPAAWVHVRQEIERRAEQASCISQQDYFEICARHLDKFDEADALQLSRYLHDLGVFLHFQDDPLLAETVILQNEWATSAVFRVLDAEVVKARFGRFTMEDCRQLWSEPTYRHKHAQLVALMEKFELCYRMRDSHPPTWLATQLLSPSNPASLHDWAKAGDLVLRYRYDLLPKGIICRLMVRLHRYVCDPEKAWRTGILFQLNENQPVGGEEKSTGRTVMLTTTMLLVKVLPSGNEVELRARGLQGKELLSVVAADLDALNDLFQGLRYKVEKHIPCNCADCAQAEEPQLYSHRYLLKRKQDRKLRMECPASYRDVNVMDLLDGFSGSPSEEMQLRPVAGLRKVRIFLASSAELRADRDEFERYFLSRNKDLVAEGLLIEVVRWEEFLDAVSATRLQDEYNRAIRQCDICVCLFATKVGKYTEEEFDVAYGQFKAEGRPRVWTYFKDVELRMSGVRKEDMKSVWAFQERLEKLGHFHTQYSDIEHLKRQFRDQLDVFLRGGGMAAGA